MAEPSARRGRITRDDLEGKLRELEGGAHEQVESARSTVVTAGVVALVLLLVVALSVGLAGQASLREAAFSVTSVVTTTGYTTAAFDSWNQFARVAILVLMFSGACAGSTAGGMKVIRSVLLAKSARQELDRAVAGIGGRSTPVRGARSAISDASPVDTATTPVRPRPTPRPVCRARRSPPKSLRGSFGPPIAAWPATTASSPPPARMFRSGSTGAAR